MLSTCESEEDEEDLREFADAALGIFLHKCGCVGCCICDDSHKYQDVSVNYGDEFEDEEYDWG